MYNIVYTYLYTFVLYLCVCIELKTAWDSLGKAKSIVSDLKIMVHRPKLATYYEVN